MWGRRKQGTRHEVVRERERSSPHGGATAWTTAVTKSCCLAVTDGAVVCLARLATSDSASWDPSLQFSRIVERDEREETTREDGEAAEG